MEKELAAEFSGQNWQVPGFILRELKPRSTRYAVVIPVFNEGERIRDQLWRMHAQGIAAQADMIIADGGSTDGSLAEDFLRETGVRALITKTGPGKLSAIVLPIYHQ